MSSTDENENEKEIQPVHAVNEEVADGTIRSTTHALPPQSAAVPPTTSDTSTVAATAAATVAAGSENVATAPMVREPRSPLRINTRNQDDPLRNVQDGDEPQQAQEAQEQEQQKTPVRKNITRGSIIGQSPSRPGETTSTTTQKPCQPLQVGAESSQQQETTENWAEFSEAWETNVAQPGRKALHNFFYPPRQSHTHQMLTPEKPPKQMPRNIRQEQIDTENEDRPKRPPPSRHSGDLHHHPRHGDKNRDTASSLHASPVIPPSPPQHQQEHHQPPPQQQPPPRQQITPQHAATTTTTTTPTSPSGEDVEGLEQDRLDREYVEKFWTAYDDILILSLSTQFGIICRLLAASWFRVFDAVFRNDSALFTNLPLNCLSCFVLGMLGSGESLMQIISTRFTPPRLQQDLHREAARQVLDGEGDFEACEIDDPTQQRPGRSWRFKSSSRRRRPRRRRKQTRQRLTSWQPTDRNLQTELREVQLLALERRIRSSPCLVLFPVKKENVDVVENYFDEGYRRKNRFSYEDDADDALRGDTDTSTFGEEPAFSLDDHDLSLDVEDNLDDLRRKIELGETNDTPSASPTKHQHHPTSLTVTFASNHCSLDEDPSTVVGTTVEDPLSGEHNGSGNGNDSRDRDRDRGDGRFHAHETPHLRERQYAQVDGGNVIDYGNVEHRDLDQIITNVATGVSQKISRMSRVRLAEGWDVGTSPEETSEDLMLGLRDGLCGALSSFSSWISSMVSLIRAGQIGQAFVGLVLGIQLPIISYRFGQHVAVYVFIWRCRRETRRDEQRGYGIRLNMEDDVSDDGSGPGSSHSLQSGDNLSPYNGRTTRTKGRRTVQDEDSETPSVRAIITALFIMAIVAQTTALNFFYKPEDKLIALSLLFSPLGVLTRWRLAKYNSWRPNFPIGTFACNIAACALSGTLGSLLAGNPGPRERIALVALIAGFGGTLSSVARFIVEILSGVDPVLFRIDGVYYAISSVFWGMVVSFVFTASVDWADSV